MFHLVVKYQKHLYNLNIYIANNINVKQDNIQKEKSSESIKTTGMVKIQWRRIQ